MKHRLSKSNVPKFLFTSGCCDQAIYYQDSQLRVDRGEARRKISAGSVRVTLIENFFKNAKWLGRWLTTLNQISYVRSHRNSVILQTSKKRTSVNNNRAISVTFIGLGICTQPRFSVPQQSRPRIGVFASEQWGSPARWAEEPGLGQQRYL